MYIYTSMHGIAKIMDNNVVSDKLKVSHILTSGGTLVVDSLHPMCSDRLINVFKENACLTDVGKVFHS